MGNYGENIYPASQGKKAIQLISLLFKLKIMKKQPLKTLSVGQKFKLDTKRFYLRHHTYQVLEMGDKIIYGFAGVDKYNQRTITSGNELVITL